MLTLRQRMLQNTFFALAFCFHCFYHFYYRPQTKFGKVMFLHVSVILSTGGGSAPLHAGIHPPVAESPTGTDTPTPGSRPPSGSRHPPAQCILGDTGNKRAVSILLECILVENVSADVDTKFKWAFSMACQKRLRNPCGCSNDEETKVACMVG